MRKDKSITFKAFSRNGTSCRLVLWRVAGCRPEEIPMERVNPDCFSVTLNDLTPGKEGVEYGFRMSGSSDPSSGVFFDDSKILNDPFALYFSASGRSLLLDEQAFEFDWEDDMTPSTTDEDLVIYELNVHNFTASPSSGTHNPGTFLALAEKIPYLVDLGINCIELMPIAEFNSKNDIWGYNSIGIFAPKRSYGSPLDFKNLVKEMHKAGIKVILDIVLNHSPDGDGIDFTNNYRFLDNKSYFMLDGSGRYLNFSGCGNTLNWTYPVLREKIIECLKYWVREYHVDGFRFDLASVFCRDGEGNVLNGCPLPEEISSYPELSGIKLIAEPWDAQGLYQLGMFSRIPDTEGKPRWSEWNDRFRDCMRHLVKSDGGRMYEALMRIGGSPDIFPNGALPINFITSHDGFTLMDLVSYNHKHNEANGENGRDGWNDNLSWNCGHEGPVDAGSETGRLRTRQVKNFLTLLFLSRGIPMIAAGDEMGHTQYGNNNAYCIDDESVRINWHDINLHKDILQFVKILILIRRTTPILRKRFETGRVLSDHLMTVKWSDPSSPVRYLMIVNTHWETYTLPLPSEWSDRKVVLNSWMPSGEDIYPPGNEVPLEGDDILVGARSVILLKGKSCRESGKSS